MKKLLSIILMLTLLVGLTVSIPLESSAEGTIVLIYESETAPVVDGSVDAAYRQIATSSNDPTGNIVRNEGCTVDDYMEVYACWNGDSLYLLLKVTCNDPHVAYMDNASEHFIFNAHYLMTALCPDNPYKDIYKGDQEDGTWTWGGLYTAQLVYEWTIINPSQDSESDIADHFLSMSSTEGFEYKVVTDGGFDYYEQKIPLESLKTGKVANGVPAEVGSLFGFAFLVGLSDFGTGYAPTTFTDKVYLSDYFTGDKYIQGMAYCKLASDLNNDDNNETSKEEKPSAITATYDLFPAITNWKNADVNGTSVVYSYSKGVSTFSGSVAGTYPSTTGTLDKTIYLAEGTYLVYDMNVDTGSVSFRLNGSTQINTLISDNIEAGTDNLLAGEYTGYITYEDLAALLGTTDDGLVAITDVTVFSVDGATCTINTFEFDPSYVPSEDPDPSEEPDISEEPSEEPDISEEPSEEPTVSADPSEEVSDTSAPVENGGSLTWLWIVIAVVVIAAAVAAFLIIKKKKAD